ncbi:MAG TPA: amidohydrolase family protein [Pyrinomonadaceae bacterium]|mgnify:CR=1 FL=1|nr:amidohydrolase family protein [Pyrinomonadaceae bacterium]
MKLLLADHVLPISSPPIRNGAVAFEAGQIAAVGDADDLRARFPQASVDDHGNAAILPGFVNCHSHLELTAMRGALDDVEHDFRSWLLKINELRAEMNDDDIVQAAVIGAQEGAAAGVTCFGDIGRFGHAGLSALKQTGLRGTVFQETEFSPDNRTADDDFRKLGEKFERLKEEETGLVKVGLSPHSPYTVGSRMFELTAQYAIINKIALSIHASESADEHDLLMRGSGFFSELYEDFGLDWNSPNCTPIEYLERLGVLSTRPLLAHCVTVSETDIGRIAANRAAVAHCPKSNAKFGHGYAPFERFRDAGIACGLGSDSVASNNVCDILEEARFAALAARNRAGSRRSVTAAEVLEAATLGGARALRLDQEIGTLEEGKQADITVVSLDAKAQWPVNDVYAALVFASNARDVVLTIVAGIEVYCSPFYNLGKRTSADIV